MRSIVIALAGVVVLGRDAPARPHCPAGAIDVPARSEAIRARLATIPEGRALLDLTQRDLARICFARGPSVIDEAHSVVLDRALADDDAAARLGHLLVHMRDGSPYRSGPDCDAVVARALDLEARAHAIELELRRALDVRAARYEFEPAFWAAPAAARVALVRAYLEAHPDGAPGGIDALASGYRARCERERR